MVLPGEAEVEGAEDKDDADVDGQPLPEPVGEEGHIDRHDHDDHGQDPSDGHRGTVVWHGTVLRLDPVCWQRGARDPALRLGLFLVLLLPCTDWFYVWFVPRGLFSDGRA